MPVSRKVNRRGWHVCKGREGVRTQMVVVGRHVWYVRPFNVAAAQQAEKKKKKKNRVASVGNKMKNMPRGGTQCGNVAPQREGNQRPKNRRWWAVVEEGSCAQDRRARCRDVQRGRTLARCGCRHKRRHNVHDRRCRYVAPEDDPISRHPQPRTEASAEGRVNATNRKIRVCVGQGAQPRRERPSVVL